MAADSPKTAESLDDTGSNTTACLDIGRLVIGYGGRPILPPFTCQLLAGQMWCLAGRNGSGKSTFLRTLLGLQPALSGSVRLSGARLSYVPQRGNYDLSVPTRVIDFIRGGLAENWSFINPLHFWSKKDLVREAAHLTQSTELLLAPVAQLSEGQKQRVLIARALVSEPQFMVLDEPTNAMDPTNERAVFALLDTLRQSTGVCVLLASHSIALARQYCTHAIYVDREQQVTECGRLEEVSGMEDLKHV